MFNWSVCKQCLVCSHLSKLIRMKILQSAERISQYEKSDHVIFQRSIFAYHEAAKLVNNTLLEVGTGMGYGLELLAPKVNEYHAIDKYASAVVKDNIGKQNFCFHQMTVPPFKGIDNEQFDFVISFQVVEHIDNDNLFLSEISRVLKKGGKAIISTPNIKMSLTRNPWHIREYTVEQFNDKLLGNFSETKMYGVYGNEKVDLYYQENKKNVGKLTRFDVFGMQYWLPRQLLQIPYDMLNRLNRRRLLKNNTEVVNSIDYTDFIIKEADDNCYDLFAVAVK